MVVSPLTGELVPLAQMAEHMRVSLIDPKWKEQREAMLAKLRGSTRAGDDEIGANLVSLARHRPDVFGAAAGPGGGAAGRGDDGCCPGVLLCALAGAWDACLAGMRELVLSFRQMAPPRRETVPWPRLLRARRRRGEQGCEQGRAGVCARVDVGGAVAVRGGVDQGRQVR
jgi:splicing factor 3A subunit 1